MLHEFSIFAHPQKLVSQNVSNSGIHKNDSSLGLYPQKLVPQKSMPQKLILYGRYDFTNRSTFGKLKTYAGFSIFFQKIMSLLNLTTAHQWPQGNEPCACEGQKDLGAVFCDIWIKVARVQVLPFLSYAVKSQVLKEN